MSDLVKPVSVSIVLPTFNEQENIAHLIPAIEAEFADSALEIIIVDDHSSDGTPRQARQLNDRYHNIRLLERPKKQGIGSALRDGYNHAENSVILSCDSDCSFRTSDLKLLYNAIGAGADMALGNRHSDRSLYETTSWTIHLKYWISRTGNFFVRTATCLPIHDFSANCRAIRKSVWEKLDTRETSNAFLLEMILKTSLQRKKIVELPVRFMDRRHGKSKLNLWVELPKYFCLLGAHLLDYWIMRNQSKTQP